MSLVEKSQTMKYIKSYTLPATSFKDGIHLKPMPAKKFLRYLISKTKDQNYCINHIEKIRSGILERECKNILVDFFKNKRKKNKI